MTTPASVLTGEREQRIARLERLRSCATQGEWKAGDSGDCKHASRAECDGTCGWRTSSTPCVAVLTPDDPDHDCNTIAEFPHEDDLASRLASERDAAYVAALHNELPWLLDQLRSAMLDTETLDYIEERIVDECGLRFFFIDGQRGSMIAIETWGSGELREVVAAHRAASRSSDGGTNG
jgi:hypothetical protein